MTPPTPASPPIRRAATVVVLRPGVDAATPLEVLMVRRSTQLAFMSGAYVFPGGRLDEHDAALDADAVRGLDGVLQATRCPELTAAEETAFRVAAIRELLEEAGVLLATHDGTPVDAATAARLRLAQPADASIAAYAASHGLRLTLDAVRPFARWVTPPQEVRRFDTLFLMARMPANQPASHDGGETTALDWVRPLEAVARAAAGAIVLAPPTWTTLNRLARFASVDEAWDWAAQAPIVRIEPEMTEHDGVPTARLPDAVVTAWRSAGEPVDEVQFARIDGVWRPAPGTVPDQDGA